MHVFINMLLATLAFNVKLYCLPEYQTRVVVFLVLIMVCYMIDICIRTPKDKE